jgi:hypothetical protein
MRSSALHRCWQRRALGKERSEEWRAAAGCSRAAFDSGLRRKTRARIVLLTTGNTRSWGFYPIDSSRILAIEVDGRQLGLLFLEAVSL